ncbi:MAG: methionine--tRNA ligase, partial [Clostridia bacterium]|nr:methionine--tRNA ligase [Clostridia bacterium]
DAHPEFITPVSRKNEMVNNFLKPGLQDLCVSRSSFTWGVPLEFDPKHVSYVWIDALSNYITAIGYDTENPEESYKKLWPADLHVIGKDIVRFHTIYWPIILMALDVPLPKKVLGHPWLLFGDSKMSKSKGNVLYGDKLAEQFGVDAVRYYLLSEMGFYNDGSITYESLIARTNSDLANIIGNLVSRTSAMIKQYFDGVVPAPTSATAEADETLKNAVNNAKEAFMAKMDEYLVADACEAVLNGFKACNKYIDETTPWVLAKDENSRDRLATVMANLVQSIRICTAMLYPYIPSTAKRIAEVFSYGEDAYDYDKLCYCYKVDGVTVNADGAKLFERIDEKKFMAAIEAEQKAAKKEKKAEEKKEKKAEKAAVKEAIGIEDFAKVELTVGKILTCEKVEKSDKLLKLTVDIGEVRQVVSGIAKWYAPDELIGKKVILVSNLRPAVLRGVESNGMILASGGDEVKVVFIDDSVPVGSKVQ